MVNEMWRVWKRGGMLFCRLASSTGMDERATLVARRRFALPHGSERYIFDRVMLRDPRLVGAAGSSIR